MKTKIIFFLAIVLCLCACSKDEPFEYPTPDPDPTTITQQDELWAYRHLVNKHAPTTIVEAYQTKMVREGSIPLTHYVLRLADGNDVCFVYFTGSIDLQPGDYVDKYYTYLTSANEVFEIHTSQGIISLEYQLDEILSNLFGTGQQSTTKSLYGTQTAKIEDVFYLNLRHSLLLFPPASILPLPTAFFVLEDGTLLYYPGLSKKNNTEYYPGTFIDYKTQILCPNRIIWMQPAQ